MALRALNLVVQGPVRQSISSCGNFPAGTTGTKKAVGASSATPEPLYAGGFDSTYLSSGSATGNMFICGNTGGAPTCTRFRSQEPEPSVQ